MAVFQPERLYHYTNIDSLALILKNRTLRLRSLIRMDDLQEAQSNSIQNYGQFVFVSSWTDDRREHLPMWKMYSSMESGVRISLPANPFKIYDLTTSAFRNPTDEERQLALSDTENYPIVDVLSMPFNFHGIVVTPSLGHQLCKVVYVDDYEEEKLNPKVEMFNEAGVQLALHSMGIYKSKAWKFQREWRYRIALSPTFKIKPGDSNWLKYPNKIMLDEILHGKLNCPRDYLDLHLADDKFSQLEITTSPCITAGHRAIVELLVKEYCPQATITSSCLENMIREK